MSTTPTLPTLNRTRFLHVKDSNQGQAVVILDLDPTPVASAELKRAGGVMPHK